MFDSLDQLQVLIAGFRWRDWPNGLGTGLWLQSREFDSLISPQMGGSYKGIIRGLQPRDASSTLAPSTKLRRFAGVSEAGARRRNPEPRILRRRTWLGNSTAECWSEKPVDTVQFRAEPPRSGSGLAGSRRVPWEHEIGSSNLPSPTRNFHKEIIIANELISS